MHIHNHSMFKAMIIAAAVLVLALPTRQAGADSGPGNGGPGPQRQTIVIQDGIGQFDLMRQLAPIAENPQIRYKIFIPNTDHRVRSALVDVIRLEGARGSYKPVLDVIYAFMYQGKKVALQIAKARIRKRIKRLERWIKNRRITGTDPVKHAEQVVTDGVQKAMVFRYTRLLRLLESMEK